VGAGLIPLFKGRYDLVGVHLGYRRLGGYGLFLLIPCFLVMPSRSRP